MQHKLLIALGTPLGLLAGYWLWQCAMPRARIVDEVFALEQRATERVNVPMTHVVGRHLPQGMRKEDALALLRRAGFTLTRPYSETLVRAQCPECSDNFNGRYDQSLLCGGEAITLTLGFRDGRLAYLSAHRVMREFAI